MRTLSHAEARRFYDRIGARQDSQAFYEDQGTRELEAHLELGEARSLFEFGCGTGRLAERWLAERLPEDARYRALDLSPRMVEIAGRRLARFAPRAEVSLSEGGAPVDEPSAAYDRFVSCFVFDLLAEAEARAVVVEAERLLRPGGLIGLCGLGRGFTLASRAMAWTWSRVHSLSPKLVGGCRPLELLELLPESRWQLRHHRRVAPFALPLEAVVAERRADP